MRKPAAVKTTTTAVVAEPAAKRTAAKTAAKPAAKTAAKAAAGPAAKPAAKAAKKPAAKAAAQPAAKAAAKPPAKAARPAARKSAAAKPVPAKAAKPAPKAARKQPSGAAPDAEPVRAKANKARLVRDSFTMPEHEYEVLGQVKKACLKAGFEIKKSELLRIGVALISQMDLATLQNVLASLPQLKTGRPKNA
jgi:hypothetical protein